MLIGANSKRSANMSITLIYFIMSEVKMTILITIRAVPLQLVLSFCTFVFLFWFFK